MSAARKAAITGVTAALYAAVTLALSQISYGPVQIRIAELMVLLCYINPVYAPGLILGCAIANLGSPMGVLDVVVGTAATACTVLAITKTKNLFVATLWPTIFCLFIGAELYFYFGYPFIATTLLIMLEEFFVVTVIGYPVYRYLLKNESVVNFLNCHY